jgi:hypothetical protein
LATTHDHQPNVAAGASKPNIQQHAAGAWAQALTESVEALEQRHVGVAAVQSYLLGGHKQQTGTGAAQDAHAQASAQNIHAHLVLLRGVLIEPQVS